MPDLDPAIVLSSPMLSDDFTITRRVQVVNDLGRPTMTAEHRCGYGIVTQAGGRDLLRLPDLQTGTNAISVLTESEVRPATPGAQPDMITFAGTSYLVKHVDPYPRYGRGWYQVLAVSTNAIDVMPTLD